MNTTIRGHYLRMTVVMALLAVLIVLAVALVFARQPAPTTSDRNASPANHAMSAGGKGGPRSVGYDPTIDRGEVNPAMSAEGKGGSSVNNDPIGRHAEVVQRLGNGSLR
jgi:hypothetical protein